MKEKKGKFKLYLDKTFKEMLLAWFRFLTILQKKDTALGETFNRPKIFQTYLPNDSSTMYSHDEAVQLLLPFGLHDHETTFSTDHIIVRTHNCL
jgi:hypothetical protein